MPRLNIIIAEVMSCSSITVEKPSAEVPIIFCTSVFMLKMTAIIKVTTPATVTICIGAEVNEVIEVTAYFTSEAKPNLLLPDCRSATSK